MTFQLKPSFRSLGQRGLGKEAQLLKTKMAALPAAEASMLYAQLAESGTITVEGIALGREDVEVQFVTKGDFAAAGGKVGMVILDTKIDDELRELGSCASCRTGSRRRARSSGSSTWIGSGSAWSEVRRSPKPSVKHRGTLAAEVLAIEVDVGHVPAGCTPDGARNRGRRRSNHARCRARAGIVSSSMTTLGGKAKQRRVRGRDVSATPAPARNRRRSGVLATAIGRPPRARSRQRGLVRRSRARRSSTAPVRQRFEDALDAALKSKSAPRTKTVASGRAPVERRGRRRGWRGCSRRMRHELTRRCSPVRCVRSGA